MTAALCVLTIGVAVVLVGQWRSSERLRREIASERVKLEQRAAELRRGVRSETATATVEADAAELARLRGDREALERLRAEVVSLKKSVGETRTFPVRIGKTDAETPPDIENEIVPADAWRNRGYATPAAAIETALWAAAGGDTDLLEKSVILGENARRKAEALFATLPEEVRRRYARPEELVAFMTAKDVPLEGARILVPREPADDGQRVAVQLRNAAGSVRQLQIDVRKTAAGWRLVMPESAVDRYAAQLKGAAAF